MTVYITEDGHRITASRAREVVETLRAESWLGRSDNVSEWMREVAGRVTKTTGQHVRSNNEANFVRDLIKVGLLKKEV